MRTEITARRRSAALSYFSLFTSAGTLLCCALPSMLVLLGLGASVASLLSFMPWLVTLSKHKTWTFAVAGSLILLSFVNVYYVAPRVRNQSCSADDPATCERASKLSKAVLWFAACLYVIGFLVAYLLGPLLAAVDRSAS
jgi:hypothetical protein